MCGRQAGQGQTSKPFPIPVGYINDFDSVLTATERNSLSILIANHKASTENEIAIVSVSSIKPYDDIFQYSLDMANEWGVGDAEKNNGVLIVMCPPLRKIHIQNGPGIEYLFTNEETKFVVDSVIVPQFKKGHYFRGLRNGLLVIFDELNDAKQK